MLFDSLWADFLGGKMKCPPLFVSLPLLQKNDGIVDACLERWDLKKDMQGQRFVLILDSFDEMKEPVHLCRVNGNFARWADHVLITGRTEAMPEGYLKDYFLPHEDESYQLMPRSVAPFSEEQVDEFLAHYAASPAAVWKRKEAYADRLAAVPGMQQLTRTPFTLCMIVDILPLLDGVQGSFTRARLFTEYTRLSFDKENARLVTASSGGGVGFLVPAFERYCEALAIIMLAGDTPNSVNVDQLPPATKEAREAAHTVKPTAQTVSFTHKSMMEYFAACAILRYLEEGAQGGAGAPMPENVVADAGVLVLLQEMVTPALARRWAQELVLGSRDPARDDLPPRAAVALTVLCALHRSLEGRQFAGVRVPGACLMGAYLQNTDLRGADLTNVDLRNANLNGVQLQDSKMAGVMTEGERRKGEKKKGGMARGR